MIVKLIKGYSYGDDVIFVKKDNPVIEVSDDEGQKLLASGYFEEVEVEPDEPVEPDAPGEDEDEEPEPVIPDEGEEDDEEEDEVEPDEKEYIVKPVDFDKMTVNELKAYAAENDIDISGLTKKADIKAALIAAINSRVPEIFEN